MGIVQRLPRKVIAGALSLAVAVSLFTPAAGFASTPSTHSTQPNDLSGTVANAQPYESHVVRAAADTAQDELLVKLEGSLVQKVGGKITLSSADLRDKLQCFGLNAVDEVLPGVYKFQAVNGEHVDLAAAKSALEQTAGVQYASRDHYYYISATPNDEQYLAGQQWGLTQIHAEQAWDVTTGDPNMIVAVLDTGAALSHPDLQDKIVPGYDFVHNNGTPQDDEGHGSMTAGIIGASTNNGTGIAGMSWGARLMPIKVCTNQGQCDDEAIAKGLRFAVDHGAKVVNASLGGDEDSQVMRDAVAYANDHNVLLVASAGNDPNGKDNFPAAYEGVLSVGATGRSDTYTGFSSFGQFVDVTAPGVGILSTAWKDGSDTYAYGNGTSFSGPFVAGLAALVWSSNPSLTAQQVRFVIMDSSDDLGDPGPDVHYGVGRVNAGKAVTLAKQGPPPTRTPKPKTLPTNTPGPSPTPANGQQGPSLQVDSKNVHAGDLLAITGGGFAPSELVDLTLTASDNANRDLGSAQTNAQGGFRAELALPKDVPAGQATLIAQGRKSGTKVTLPLTIQAGQAPSKGQSVVKGTIRGASGAGVQVKLKPSVGVAGPELTAGVDANGQYVFNGLAAGIYSLVATAPGYLQAGPFSVQVDGTGGDVKVIDITLVTTRPAAFDKVAPVNNTGTLVFFPAVGHTLRGSFLKFWQTNGGLPIFGYPLSEEYKEVSPTDGKTYTVQYFERNRFELHPEFAGTKNEVLMGLLGVEITRGRTFPPGAPFQSTASSVYFKETQHSLSGAFLKYWQSHGGLPIFGYPISEEVEENGYVVQYFERNRFELHPEFAGTPNEVLLGLLGVEVVKRNGWITP